MDEKKSAANLISPLTKSSFPPLPQSHKTIPRIYTTSKQTTPLTSVKTNLSNNTNITIITTATCLQNPPATNGLMPNHPHHLVPINSYIPNNGQQIEQCCATTTTDCRRGHLFPPPPITTTTPPILKAQQPQRANASPDNDPHPNPIPVPNHNRNKQPHNNKNNKLPPKRNYSEPLITLA